jgi:subfamily B ATP-binding cassette protein MsbA
VAIVGQSGSGKTTIADLIFKIYRPEEGEVLLDGISTDFYSKSNLSQQLAIVSQEPALFNRSIIENIRYNS